jgi:tartrate-resistant acid phosphatase type 5
MQQTRRQFLWHAGALAAAPLLLGAARAIEPVRSLSFLAVGDWGKPQLSGNARAVALQMANQAQAIGASFIISTGDNFYEQGVASAADPLWQTVFEQVYAAPALQVPWYIVLGNHDYAGQPDAELAYALQSRRWKLPARYYVEQRLLPDGTTADFFFLDTNLLVNVNFANRWFDEGADAQEQLEWLDTMLTASPARWKFVVGHHPIYSAGEHGDTLALIEGVLPLLKRHGVQVYINGHDHDLEHATRDGIHFLTTGGGAELNPVKPVTPPGWAAASLGFLSATLTPEQLDIAFINEAGAILHHATIPG